MKLSKAAETQRMSQSRFPVAVPYPSPHRATPAYVVVTSSDLGHEQEQGIGERTFMDKQVSNCRYLYHGSIMLIYAGCQSPLAQNLERCQPMRGTPLCRWVLCQPLPASLVSRRRARVRSRSNPAPLARCPCLACAGIGRLSEGSNGPAGTEDASTRARPSNRQLREAPSSNLHRTQNGPFAKPRGRNGSGRRASFGYALTLLHMGTRDL